MKIFITVPTFSIMVFRNVWFVSGNEVFKAANQRNNNALETSDFANTNSPLWRDGTTEESL